MTDDTRLNDPSSIIPSLPEHSAVVVRSSSLERRDILGRQLLGICRQHGVVLLMSYEFPPARLFCDGIHVPEKSRTSWSRKDFHRLRPSLITTSAHSLRAATQAGAWGADAVMLSPIAVTQSHMNSQPLGLWRGAAIRRHLDIRTIALGGIDSGSVKRTLAMGFDGCAGISLFKRDPNQIKATC